MSNVIPYCPVCSKLMRTRSNTDELECRCGFTVAVEATFSTSGPTGFRAAGRILAPWVQPDVPADGIVTDKFADIARCVWSTDRADDRLPFDVAVFAIESGRKRGLIHRGKGEGSGLPTMSVLDGGAPRELKRQAIYGLFRRDLLSRGVDRMVQAIVDRNGPGYWWSTGPAVVPKHNGGNGVSIHVINRHDHVVLCAYYFHDPKPVASVVHKCARCELVFADETAVWKHDPLKCLVVRQRNLLAVEQTEKQARALREEKLAARESAFRVAADRADRADALRDAIYGVYYPDGKLPARPPFPPLADASFGDTYKVVHVGNAPMTDEPVAGVFHIATPSGPVTVGNCYPASAVEWAALVAAAGLDPEKHKPSTLWTCKAPPPTSTAHVVHVELKTRPADPLDAVIDGWKLRDLIAIDRSLQQEVKEAPFTKGGRAAWTPAQRAAVSAHWSAQLRAKVEASRKADEARKMSVVIEHEVD